MLSCSPLGTSRLSQAKGAAADEIRKLNKNSQEHHKKAGSVWGQSIAFKQMVSDVRDHF